MAKVNGADITRADVRKALEQQDNGQVLEALITRQLVRQKAKERGIKVSEDEINQRIAVMGDYALAESGQTLDAWLKEHGQTLDDVKDAVSLQILTSKLVIPDSEKKKFFEDNKAQFASLPHNNESVIYRQLVVGTKEEADALRKQIEGAKDKDAEFAKVAKEKSLDAMTRPRGGMKGWMIKGKPLPGEQETEKALFALKPGEVSEPLRYTAAAAGPAGQSAPTQWQLVTVVKHIPAHQMRLEDNVDQIEGAMLQTPTSQNAANLQLYMQAQQFFQDLQAKANIEILSPKYTALGEKYKQQKEAANRMGGGMPGMMPAPQGGPSGAPAGKAPAAAPAKPKK